MKEHIVELERHIRHLAPCPVDGCEGRCDVTHVVQWARERELRQNVGPWHCKECGMGIFWSVPVPDPVEQTIQVTGKISGQRKIERLALLDLDERTKNFQIVVRGMRFEGGRDYDDMEQCDHDSYYYNEHTCPTNYLEQIEVVLEGDDADPHGIFRFVKAVDLDEAMQKRLCEMAGPSRLGAFKDDWDQALCNLNAEEVRSLFEKPKKVQWSFREGPGGYVVNKRAAGMMDGDPFLVGSEDPEFKQKLHEHFNEGKPWPKSDLATQVEEKCRDLLENNVVGVDDEEDSDE